MVTLEELTDIIICDAIKLRTITALDMQQICTLSQKERDKHHKPILKEQTRCSLCIFIFSISIQKR